jgi:hypothetical protein
MGRTRCEKHGLAGVTETCVHVAEYVDRSSFGDFLKISAYGELFLCHACMEAGGFERFRSETGEWRNLVLDGPEDLCDEYEAQYERIMGRRIYCSECVAAAQVEHARRSGQPDPFPVYENTITANNPELVEKLKTALDANFKIPRSIVNKDQTALFVMAGHYRTPLVVKAYYIHDQAEQDRLIDFVKQLFNGPPFYQARIELWDAEVWTTWTNARTGASGGSRGNETLLREAYVNCS